MTASTKHGQRRGGDAGADLPGTGGGVEDAGRDLRRDAQLDDPPGVDAERRSSAVEDRDPQARAAAPAHTGRAPRWSPACVAHRATDEGGDRWRAGGRRGAQADELEHGAVTDVGRTRLGTLAGVVQGLADGRRAARGATAASRRGGCRTRCRCGPSSSRSRSRARPSPIPSTLGRRPSRRAGRRGGCRRGTRRGRLRRRSSRAARWGKRSRSSRLVLAWTRIWTSSPICRPCAAIPSTSIGPWAARHRRAAGRRRARNRSRSTADGVSRPNQARLARPLVQRGEGTVPAGRVLDDPHRLRRAERRHHRDDGVVVVGRRRGRPTGAEQGVGGVGDLRPPLGDHRGPHRPPQRGRRRRRSRGRAAVEERHAVEARNDVGGGPDPDGGRGAPCRAAGRPRRWRRRRPPPRARRAGDSAATTSGSPPAGILQSTLTTSKPWRRRRRRTAADRC